MLSYSLMVGFKATRGDSGMKAGEESMVLSAGVGSGVGD